MRRALIFSLAYFPHVGGAEIAIKEITDRIPEIEWHMLTLRFDLGQAKEEKIGNINVHRIGSGSSYLSKILFLPRAAFSARSMHKSLRFDMFWAMMSYMLWPIVLLRVVGIRVPYVLTLQEGDPWEHMFSRWFIIPFRSLLRVGFKNATTVQAISTYLGRWAERMGFGGEVKVIPNGVDLRAFVEGTNIIKADAKEIYLVTASRLVHKNAIDDVIRALLYLPDNVRFIIYGNGSEEESLRELALELGVFSRVEFMGYTEHNKLTQAYKTAHIFIRPSRSEGMGNAFIEAMAAGLPVIATQEGGIADFLFDERRNPGQPTTGWAVDVGSPEQISEAVKDIILNPDKVARVRANVRTMVQDKYDWNIIANQMRDMFSKTAVK